MQLKPLDLDQDTKRQIGAIKDKLHKAGLLEGINRKVAQLPGYTLDRAIYEITRENGIDALMNRMPVLIADEVNNHIGNLLKNNGCGFGAASNSNLVDSTMVKYIGGANFLNQLRDHINGLPCLIAQVLQKGPENIQANKDALVREAIGRLLSNTQKKETVTTGKIREITTLIREELSTMDRERAQERSAASPRRFS